MKQSKMVGKRVVITDKESPYYNEWGTIMFVDDYYHIAIANGQTSLPAFDRDQFKVKRAEKS